METLHIYAQEVWHEDAHIAGTRDALESLRDAIDRALTTNNPGKAEAFCCDGEGYTVHIVLVSDEQAAAMPVPYTDACAKAKEDRMDFGPWALMRSNALGQATGAAVCARSPGPEGYTS